MCEQRYTRAYRESTCVEGVGYVFAICTCEGVYVE